MDDRRRTTAPSCQQTNERKRDNYSTWSLFALLADRQICVRRGLSAYLAIHARCSNGPPSFNIRPELKVCRLSSFVCSFLHIVDSSRLTAYYLKPHRAAVPALSRVFLEQNHPLTCQLVRVTPAQRPPAPSACWRVPLARCACVDRLQLPLGGWSFLFPLAVGRRRRGHAALSAQPAHSSIGGPV